MANATDSVSGLGLFNLGNGLIEIATLTSLIGSVAAQSLAMGDKGPAGIVWSTMTIFGAMSVITLFTATATPGWLRDSVGVRSAKSDAVTGLSLDLNKSFKYRGRGETAQAIECETYIEKFGKNPSKKMTDFPVEGKRREVYVFDQRTANILNAISPSMPGEDLKVFSFIEDHWHKKTASYHLWLDWLLLGLSVVAKLVEAFVHWKYGASILALITISNWLFFFVAAVILQLYDLRRQKSASEIDAISGYLPTCSTTGGARKVLLGITKSPRQHAMWRIIWGLGATVGLITVISTYVALGHSTSAEVFFIWTAFQILWLVCRSTIYYMLSDRGIQYNIALEGKPWAKIGPQERTRVCRLVLALSKYQQHLHPRNILSYAEDMDAIESLPNMQSTYLLTSSSPETVEVSICGIIGDTLLSSAVWVFGSKRGGFDFYDTCVLILNTSDGRIAIPVARALSGKPPQEETDSESGVQTAHLPRGGFLPQGSPGNLNYPDDVRWCFWVPCDDGRWLFFTTHQTRSRGTWQASIVSDQQVTESLERGIFISLKHVDEVREITETSAAAYEYVLELFR